MRWGSSTNASTVSSPAVAVLSYWNLTKFSKWAKNMEAWRQV